MALDSDRILPASSRRNNVKSALWSIVEVAVTPALMVVATPIFLNKLGAVDYGIWMTITSIVTVLGVVNFGGDATIRFIAAGRANNNKTEADGAINAALLFGCLVLAVLIPAGLFLPQTILRTGIIRVEQEYADIFSQSMKFAMWLLGLKIIEQSLFAIPKGMQRFDVATMISCTSKISTIVVQIALVLSGLRLNWVLAGSIAISLVLIAVELLVLRNAFPELSFVPKRRFDMPHGYLKFAIWAWLYAAIGVMSTQADKLIVASCVDMKILAYYAIAAGIFTQIHGLFSATASWIFPKVAGAANKLEKHARLYYKMQYGLISFGWCALGALSLVGGFIFPLWLGDSAWEESRRFIELFLALAAFELPTIVPYYFFRSIAIEASVFFKMGNIVVNLGGMILGFRIGGSEGMIVGRIASPLIVNTLSRLYFHKRIFSGCRDMAHALAMAVPAILWTLVFTDAIKDHQSLFGSIIITAAVLAFAQALFACRRTAGG